jgi:hypothetical protein
MTSHRLLLAGSLAVAIFTAAALLGATRPAIHASELGPFSVVQVANAAGEGPSISESDARVGALSQIQHLRPDLRGFEVTAARFASNVLKVTDATGKFEYDGGGKPQSVWILEATAPGQAGWKHVMALVVIDAKAGQILSSGVGTWN